MKCVILHNLFYSETFLDILFISFTCFYNCLKVFFTNIVNILYYSYFLYQILQLLPFNLSC